MSEDNLFEYLTAVFFLINSVLLFILFSIKRNISLLLLAVAMLFASGEEISWGQRLFKFSTPEPVRVSNVQGELNIHNLELFNSLDMDGNRKKGIGRLFEINFIFRIFMLFFGILLPFCVYHSPFVARNLLVLRLPIPPLSIGVFFAINWLLLKTLYLVLPHGKEDAYYNSEIFECVSSYILLTITVYFFNRRNINFMGLDIKQMM